MNAFSRAFRIVTAGALAASLSACISVFPKDEPSQLYRFDGTPPAREGAAAGGQFGVVRAGGGFVQAAASDRLLTTDGGHVAYIADSRWVSPAQTLFNEAMHRAFDANTGPARLMARGELGKTDYSLRVDVTRFEAVYDRGAKAAPNVVVSLRVTLMSADRALVGSRQIEAQVRAGDNRVAAIVAAYDQAVGQVLGELVDWTNARGTSA